MSKNGHFMISATLPQCHIDFLASNSMWFFSKSAGNFKKPISETKWSYIVVYESRKLVFCNFPWILKKTTLSLMLENQCGNVASWLKSWNGHFGTSDPLRFGPEKVLFYLVKWQKCCFERSYLKLFWVPGACLMARMAQNILGVHLWT